MPNYIKADQFFYPHGVRRWWLLGTCGRKIWKACRADS